MYVCIQPQTAGRNKAELGEATAHQRCSLDPEGFALWTDHCVFTTLQLCVCVFNVCVLICLQITQCENGAEETQ